MSHVIPGQALDTEAQAAAWLIRLDSDRSVATWAQWKLWMAADTRHRAAYLRVERAWSLLDGLKSMQPLDGRVDTTVLDTFPPGMSPRLEPSLRNLN